MIAMHQRKTDPVASQQSAVYIVPLMHQHQLGNDFGMIVGCSAYR